MNVDHRDRISVCVCTFRRPQLLARLLESLVPQVRDPDFSFDVVVVDNDGERSAEETVRAFQLRRDLEIIYDCEPERNISLTRNRAVRNAEGNLIAFIDDDEYASGDWLSELHRTLNRYNADGVLGPVLPDFPPAAPAWLRKGNFFDRRRLATGSTISQRDARTGNVLFRRKLFPEGEMWFDPAYGRTGGEDADFFRRRLSQGRTFVWCDEAVAYETVPPERWTASFHIEKYFRIGTTGGRLVRAGEVPRGAALFRNLAALVGFSAFLPVSFILGKHVWMRALMKLAYSSAFLLTASGLSQSRHRN